MSESLPDLHELDLLVARYAAAWHRGEATSIEACLATLPATWPWRRELLWRLVAVELGEESPATPRSSSAHSETLELVPHAVPPHRPRTSAALDDYLARFPDLVTSADVPDDIVLLFYRRQACERATKNQSSTLASALTLPVADPVEHASSREQSADSTELPRRFGDYELLAKIAQGGMGIVYRARQVDLDRVVAVKMILAGQFATSNEVERFRTEALAAAQLQHPSIVAIHEVGKIAGQHFFSMDFVEGHSLDELVREHPLPARRAAAYVAEIAEAIHYAHEQGVLHRDLKPANVLVDQTNRTRVTDFGLAKRIDDASNLTATGAMIGTPSYMPPEQVRGDHEQLGPPADVYALGAILYELLTTRPPFQAESPLDTFVQVVNNDPVAPSLLNPKVPRDLETICLKCLEKEPTRRYPTAAELAADLRRFVAGEPILARPVGRAERLVRWCRRRPALASLAAALVLAVVVGFAAVTWQWRRAEANFNQAATAGGRMMEAIDELLRSRPSDLEFDPSEQKWLDDTIQVYQQLQELNRGSATAQFQTALGYGRLGRIYAVLNRAKDARDQYDLAIRQLDQLVSASPQEPSYRRSLAEMHNLRGQVLRQAGGKKNRDEALSEYGRAIQWSRELAEMSPNDPRNRRVLANAYYNRGILYADDGDLESARQEFDRALSLQEELAQQHVEQLEFRHELARTYKSRGSLLSRDRQYDLALEAYARALELYDALLAEAEEAGVSDRDFAFESAVCSLNRGNALSQKGVDASNDDDRRAACAAAREEFARAIAKLRALADRYPGVPSYLDALANSYNDDGVVQSLEMALASADSLPTAEAYREIVSSWTDARHTYDDLIEIRPAVVSYRQRLADVLVNLAQIRFSTDQSEDRAGTRTAKELLDEAIEQQRFVLEGDPANELPRIALARMYLVRGQTCLYLEDASGAAKDATRAIEFAPLQSENVILALEVLAGCLIDEQGQPIPENAAASYVGEAVRTMQRSLAAGVFTASDLRDRELLAPLLSRPELAAILDADGHPDHDSDAAAP